MNTSKHWAKLLEELALQRQCLDMMNAGWIGEFSSGGGVVHCARGCHKCCSLAVNCTLTEAIALEKVLDQQQLAAVKTYSLRLREQVGTADDLKEYLQIQRREMGMCPLLDAQGSCGVYATRPLSCRSLLSTLDSYWCGVEFATITPAEKEIYIASLDPAVTAFPLHYAASPQETGRDFELRQLAHMQELLGFSCYGCMPVLVSLVHEHALAEAESMVQAERLTKAAGFASRFLVSWLP